MYFLLTNCFKNIVAFCLIISLNACTPLLNMRGYEGPAKSMETNVIIHISCPGELMDGLIQQCILIEAPQRLEREQIPSLNAGAKFHLTYHFIYTPNLNRILSMLEENSQVKVSVSKQ